MITQKDIADFRRVLKRLRAAQADDVLRITAAYEAGELSESRTQSGIVLTHSRYAGAVGKTTRDFLVSGHDGKDLRTPPISDAASRGKAARAANFYLSTVAERSGAAERLLTDLDNLAYIAQRRFTASMARKNRVKWRRDASPDACEFCRMTALNEYSFNDADQAGAEYHDHCECVAVLADDYETPPHVEEWAEQYEEARANAKEAYGTVSPDAVLAAWRAGIGRGGSLPTGD